jgi:hypothetical protein
MRRASGLLVLQPVLLANPVHVQFNAFIQPTDKINMAPYRVVHFVVVAFMVTRFLRRDWPGLEWTVFRPMIVCGQHSLEVFCSGVFLEPVLN